MADAKKTKAPVKKMTTKAKVTASKVAPKVQKNSGINILNVKGEIIGQKDAPDFIFKVKQSPRLIAQYIRVYLANQRQGTHKTKTRGEVNASTRKMYKQKGTGRARHSAKSAPIFVGGGVAHGVHPRDYTLHLNTKQRQKALYVALSQKFEMNLISILDFGKEDSAKTKNVVATLKATSEKNIKPLFVLGRTKEDVNIKNALRNAERVSTTFNYLLNAYEIVNAQKIYFTPASFEEFVSFRTLVNQPKK